MAALLSIGEFSRLTHLSVKALRHYDDVGLLAPTTVDRDTGYRYYATAQVPAAQLIRRLRDLDMPIDDVRDVLHAPDLAARDRALVAHLDRMQARLAETQSSITSLRALLEGRAVDLSVQHRVLPATHALALLAHVEWDDLADWLTGALENIGAVIGAYADLRAGPDAALYSREFFEAHVGEVVAYVPTVAVLPGRGAVERIEVPETNAAVMVHVGLFSDLDETYGAVGSYVTERFLGAGGPIREHYLDETHTEVCWPIR